MLVKKLPIEILQNIIYYLSRQDRTTCQTICKKWYKVFISVTYHTVQINSSIQFQKFFNHTLNNSIYPKESMFAVGAQVRNLSIENGHIEPLALGQLPLLLPFLQVFVFDGTVLSKESLAEPLHHYQQRINKQELDKINHHFVAWKHMRQLVQSNGICAAHALLASSSSLTHLSVQFNNPNDRTNSKQLFISLLKNAPLLQSLSMERIYLDIDELEQIHQNNPELSSLTLINTVFLPITCLLQVQLAQPLRRLVFSDVNFSGDTTLWLEYICKKYTGVKVLEISENNVSKEQDEAYQHQLLQIAVRFTRLKILRLLPLVLGHSFFEALDRNGRYLTELGLGDGVNTRQLAKELKALMKSKQTGSILSLSIHGPCSLLMLDTIQACKNITALDLSMPITNSNLEPVDLGCILKNCTKLTKLTLSNANLLVNQFDSRKQRFKLQSILLIDVVMDSETVFEMIRFQCPELNSLSLIDTVAGLNSRKLDIYLPQHELKMLVMDRIRVSRRCSIRLGVSRFKISTEESKWYDLIRYECCRPSPTAKNRTSLNRMRARKVKVTTHGLDQVTDDSLGQSTHVSVQCKDIQSIYLTGLKVK